jgi:3-deoxy-7-phosphoheptulonate synthase
VTEFKTWRDMPAAQQPEWGSPEAMSQVVERLRTLPPLVFAGECDELRARLAAVARGEAFLLQGGDCAETFAGTSADAIRDKIKTLLQMAVVLAFGASLPVVKVGRLAGQFGKPRSNNWEIRDGLTLPAYRGDAVNDIEFTAAARTPDPQRLLRAYNSAAATLNLVRAFTQGGYADLRQVHEWNRGFLRGSAAMARYEQVARDIDRALRFVASCGTDPAEFRTVDLYTSHEALLLEYEDALTRIDWRTGLPYDCSAHFLWIGERTRQLDGAHVTWAAGIRNPIGVKLGPTTTAVDALALVDRLDPDREPGRLTFITRMGARNIRDTLPRLVREVTASGAQVVWVCDPMHGNTYEAPSGVKTRRFGDVIDEVRGFFEVHHELGTFPGGVHVELTGEDVTECVGGSGGLGEVDLATRYDSVCDPRLSHQQSLEFAFLVSEMLAEGRA